MSSQHNPQDYPCPVQGKVMMDNNELYGKDGLLDQLTCAAQGIHRIAQECRVVMAQQRARSIPELPKGAGLFAVNCQTGQWHYINHAGTWQGMPDPLRALNKVPSS